MRLCKSDLWLHFKVTVEALHEGVDFDETLTRSKFEALNAQQFKNTLGPVPLRRFYLVICTPLVSPVHLLCFGCGISCVGN